MICRTELTIEGAIRDPMIGALLKADRVDPRRFEEMLRTTQRRLADAPTRVPPSALLTPPSMTPRAPRLG